MSVGPDPDKLGDMAPRPFAGIWCIWTETEYGLRREQVSMNHQRCMAQYRRIKSRTQPVKPKDDDERGKQGAVNKAKAIKHGNMKILSITAGQWFAQVKARKQSESMPSTSYNPIFPQRQLCAGCSLLYKYPLRRTSNWQDWFVKLQLLYTARAERKTKSLESHEGSRGKESSK
ncbi:hypothetical protein K504DRAFT_462083 [Pleomassaria siparia CBS 279.74]|uniref:Uncharacterized protein n=1 Tax=Pleomassaria siparia CBS 279.74 TaxID=1314801 RepID=A0A6G1KL54_9PLEO|nr:hypothetical protein K504DRAFT_462083 [Pleomassaria siparia CBS 279.74]